MLPILLLVALPLISAQTTVTIPKANSSDEFLERFHVIAQGIIEAVGVANNCSSTIFEKFVKGDSDATWKNLKACVEEKVDFEKTFKTPLQNYQTQFQNLVEAEKAALATKVNKTKSTLEEKASKIGKKLEDFGKSMLDKLKKLGVSIKESDFFQGMKNAADDMKEKVNDMFDKIKNFFG